MRQLTAVLCASLVGAPFCAGCSPNPPSGGAGSETRPAGQVPYEVTERFSADTGIKDSEGKPTGCTGIAVSPDGKRALILAAAKAGNVQVWDLESRKKLAQHDCPNGSSLPTAISPDGKLGAYPSQQQGAIVLLDLAGGNEVRRLTKKTGSQLSYYTPGLAFSPKGDLVIVASKQEIVGWDPATGKERFVLQDTAEVSALSGFFDDGKKVASGTEAGGIKVWDLAAEKEAQTLLEGKNQDKKGVKKLFVSPDGQRLGADVFLAPFQLWDLSAGKQVKEFRIQNFLWYTAQFLPDNRTLVYNGVEAFFLQDALSGETKKFGENKQVRHYPVALTPDGSTLVSTEEDGTLRVWDVKAAR